MHRAYPAKHHLHMFHHRDKLRAMRQITCNETGWELTLHVLFCVGCAQEFAHVPDEQMEMLAERNAREREKASSRSQIALDHPAMYL
eukprot:6198885-Pleurochrysis_carterae.AAC.3